MDFCQRTDNLGDTSSPICPQPLPCPVHGTRREDVVIRAEKWQWLIEPLPDGVLITLLEDDRGVETRWCSQDDGAAGMRRLQEYMLAHAGLSAAISA